MPVESENHIPEPFFPHSHLRAMTEEATDAFTTYSQTFHTAQAQTHRGWTYYDRTDDEDRLQLKMQLGLALFHPDQTVNTEKTLEVYTAAQQQQIEAVFTILETTANPASTLLGLTIVYVLMEADNEEEGLPTAHAVFRVRTSQDSFCFLDASGRRYTTWSDFLRNNLLPAGPRRLSYPPHGIYSENETAWTDIEYGTSRTPSRALHFADVTCSTAGLISMVTWVGMTVAGPMGPAIAALSQGTGVIAGLWATGRGTSALLDRYQHAQSVSLQDADSRKAWYDCAKGAMGISM